MTGEQKPNLAWLVLRANRPGNQPKILRPTPLGGAGNVLSHQAALPKGLQSFASDPLKRVIRRDCGQLLLKIKDMISLSFPLHALKIKGCPLE